MNNKLIVVKRTSSRKQLYESLKKLNRRKSFDAKKYLGSLKGVFGDAINFQTRLRDEWE